MTTGRPQLIWLFVLFLAGSAIGFIVGAYSGANFGMGLVANNTLRRDAQVVDAQLDALGRLRAGDVTGAIEILEATVDDSLVIFDPHEPLPGIDAATDARVAEAIGNARRYRQAHPRDSARPAVDAMVRALFERHAARPASP